MKYRRLIPWGWTALAAITYLATYSTEVLCIRLGVDVADVIDPMLPIRAMLLCACAGLYAVHRVVRFHPVFDKGYLQWLTISPWDSSKPFPLGPPHIVWVDVVVVGIMTVLAHINGVFSPLLPAIAFLAVYLALSGVALGLVPDYLGYSAVALVLAPFAIYPHRDPRLGFAVLLGLNAWICIGFRREFKSFPWNTSYWTANAVERLRKGFVVVEIVGWLNQMLRREDKEPAIPILGALFIAGFATWWLHVVLWTIGGATGDALVLVAALCVPSVIVVRTAVYLKPGYRAPISFWGRLFTFRWIIPRYHIVYLGPACMAVGLACILTFGHLFELSNAFQCELLVFVEILLAISMPPSLRSWRLTGAHRMVEKSKRMQQQSKITVPAGPKATWSLWG